MIGRFISPDTIVPSPANPQTLNRYSYCLNNPLKYTDPSGHLSWGSVGKFFCGIGNSIKSTVVGTYQMITHPTETFKALDKLLASPDYVVAGAIWDDLSTKSQSAYGWGQITGDVGMFLLPTKGLDKVGKIGAIAKVTEKIEAVTSKIPAVVKAGEAGYWTPFAELGGTGKTVLGKVGSYEPLAQKLGANYLHTHDQLWEALSKEQQWALNKQFLDEAIARGDEFILANPVKSINDVTGQLRKELDYLTSKEVGFSLSADGTKLVK